MTRYNAYTEVRETFATLQQAVESTIGRSGLGEGAPILRAVSLKTGSGSAGVNSTPVYGEPQGALATTQAFVVKVVSPVEIEYVLEYGEEQYGEDGADEDRDEPAGSEVAEEPDGGDQQAGAGDGDVPGGGTGGDGNSVE